MPNLEATLPTRVSVLEHSVAEVKSGLDSHRGETRLAFGETRVAFAALQSTMENIRGDIGKSGKPTNWYGFIGAAAGAVVILGAVFGLAEWRMINGTQPLVESARQAQSSLQRAQDDIVALRIQQGIMESEHKRVSMEQEARIRSRVEAESRSLSK